VDSSSRILRISPAGLRGVVGAGLSVTHALDFASAFGTLLSEPGAVIVGRDPRASGLMLNEAVTASLLACGRGVVDLGVVATPVIQHAIQRRGAAGGVSIGASHNAAEWNALKFLGPGGTYLATAEANELLDIYHLRKFAYADWSGLGKREEDREAVDRYLEDLEQVFDFEALRRFRVVVDCCNGTSAITLARLNERYGFGFVLINARTGGGFAHEPEINARTVALQLAPLVKPLSADAGFLFDADSDRVAVATEQGDPVSEEMVLPLAADYQLARGRGKLVLTNLSTTALAEEVAARHGGQVVRVAVGRSAAMDALAAYRADQIALAGEGTGAIMLPQFRFVYDGVAAMLAILTIMNEQGRPLSEIVRSFPRYSMLKGETKMRPARIPALFRELREQYADGVANTLDGLRIDYPGRWFHVRVSQTEPIVRVICEQRGEPPCELFDKLMDQVRSLA
jgi:phosphomannomutase